MNIKSFLQYYWWIYVPAIFLYSFNGKIGESTIDNTIIWVVIFAIIYAGYKWTLYYGFYESSSLTINDHHIAINTNWGYDTGNYKLYEEANNYIPWRIKGTAIATTKTCDSIVVEEGEHFDTEGEVTKAYEKYDVVSNEEINIIVQKAYDKLEKRVKKLEAKK